MRKIRNLLLSLVLLLAIIAGVGYAERRLGEGTGGEGEFTLLENVEKAVSDVFRRDTVKEAVTSVEEYYYQHLEEELKPVYRELFNRIMNDEDSANLNESVDADGFWKAYYAVQADHPEIFWLGSSAQIKESAITGRIVGYELETTVAPDDRPGVQASIEASADQCLNQVWSEASDYDKIKFVYEYIIETTDYVSGSENSQNIQSVFLNRQSVCAGYAKATQYLLNRMGIFCTYITGRITDGGDHGWNMVRIGSDYYYVDTTWGDPVFANAMENGTAGRVINYNYLCCPQTELFKTHVPDYAVPLPECYSDDYNYYKRYGYYYDTFDYDTIYNALMNSVWNDESYIVMKFGSLEAYYSAAYELFENGMLQDAGQYLMEINGVSSWNYQYNCDENFYLITIYWK